MSSTPLLQHVGLLLMNRNQKILYVQKEILSLNYSLLSSTKISPEIKNAIYLLGLNLPYSYIENTTGFKQSYLRKIKSIHKEVVVCLQEETANLYSINGIN